MSCNFCVYIFVVVVLKCSFCGGIGGVEGCEDDWMMSDFCLRFVFSFGGVFIVSRSGFSIKNISIMVMYIVGIVIIVNGKC